MDDDLKSRLLKPRIDEDTIDIDGVGTVRVRALTRSEVLRLQQIRKLGARERAMLVLGMVEPAMDDAEVGMWYRASPAGEIEKVAMLIARISGLEVDAPKQAYRDFEDDPDAEFRVLPGTGVASDGGRSAGADD